MFNIGGCDQFKIVGGFIELNERLISTNQTGVAGQTMRGFYWSDPTIYNYLDPQSNGIIYFDDNGGLLHSSGTVLSGFNIYHSIPTTNPTFAVNGFRSLIIDNWNVYHTAGGNSGGGMLVYSGAHQIIFTNNKIWGTSNAGMSSNA